MDREHARARPLGWNEMAPHIHTATFRVVMSEVDVAQIHFTAVHRWMDRGLSEWLAEVGHPFTGLLETGPGIPIVETRCSFVGRILLDDVIDQRSEIGGIGRTSFRSRHLFTRAGETMARGELVHVCVDRDTRETVPVPDWLRAHAVTDPDT
jgi:acyl-CoA thioesterase FadM